MVLILVLILVFTFFPVGNSPSINFCMRSRLSADISIIFVHRLVFILIFVLGLFAICSSTSDSVRLSFIANLCLVFDLYHSANMFLRVCISTHGCTSIGTDLLH